MVAMEFKYFSNLDEKKSWQPSRYVFEDGITLYDVKIKKLILQNTAPLNHNLPITRNKGLHFLYLCDESIQHKFYF